jgi:hypothetical protein
LLATVYFWHHNSFMERKKITFYEVLVYIAYGFFILLGLVWFVMSFSSSGGRFNYTAFSIMVIFAAQAWFRHRLTNLILGILALFFSIFMLLDVISAFDLMAKNASYDNGAKELLGLSVVSIVMSVILVFGYTRLSFKDR